MPLRAILAAFLVMLLPMMAMAQEPAAAPPSDQAVQQLLDILQNETSRNALVQQLQAQVAATPAATAAPEEPPAFAQQIAEQTATFGRELTAELGRLWTELTRIWVLVQDVRTAGSLSPEAIALILTVVTTIAASAILGQIAGAFARRHTPPPTAGFAQRAKATGISVLFRLIALHLAWALGFVLATAVFSSTGVPSQSQTLYLNAFFVFGLVRVLLRAITSPDADKEPALSILAPAAQSIVYGNIVMVAGLVIQGFLFILPLTRLWLGFATVRPLRTLIATIAAILALIAIRRMARALDKARGDRATADGQPGSAVAEGAHSTWRRIWPVLGFVYVVYCWFIAVTRPNLIEEIVLRGTIYTVIALLILVCALRLLKSASAIRVRLPKAVLGTLPNIESRLNRLMTTMAAIVALVLLIVAVTVGVTGWGWIDSSVLMTEGMQNFLWRLLSALLIAAIAAVIWAVIDGWIAYRLRHAAGGGAATSRTRTLLSLFRNAFTIAIAIFATMITMSQLGIDIAPLIAGAGVIGLAIGFGSQKLVQDVITGIFIQLENAINEGDVIEVAGIAGSVEKVSIRSVRVRAGDGAINIVPFSSVDTVTNRTRDFGQHQQVVKVAYYENVAKVKAALDEAFERLKALDNDHVIIGGLAHDGVIAALDNTMSLRANIKTLPGKHWGIGNKYTELVRDVFEEKGISVPPPQSELIFPPDLRMKREA
ncbi:mechanosensitive ion channel domain-containing protein [Falsirhodobacter xinxiangensis]|uniref:mechanosensitive ion channel domain-containing protein n=1 Tax=Falsirhodobacter xinxiangensis TaxID=2530049 RepID=UPI00145A082C|nr:mechanosensitive ion channel domain-containing protein [Rhodobacter xinxiangensis]